MTSFQTLGESKDKKKQSAGPSNAAAKQETKQEVKQEDKPKVKTISADDALALSLVLDEEAANGLTQAYQDMQTKKLPSGFNLSLGSFADKEKRTELHKVGKEARLSKISANVLDDTSRI